MNTIFQAEFSLFLPGLIRKAALGIIVFQCILNFLIVANQHIFFSSMPVMHPISQAILVVAAFFTLTGFGPASIAESLVFALPYFVKIILINVSLCEISVNIRTGRNGTVD
jgi:hypothetical protein